MGDSSCMLNLAALLLNALVHCGKLRNDDSSKSGGGGVGGGDLNSCLWMPRSAAEPLASSLPPPFCDLFQAMALCVCVKISLNALPRGQSVCPSEVERQCRGVQRDGKSTFSSLPKAWSQKKKEEKSCLFPFFSPHTSNANAKCVVLGPE